MGFTELLTIVFITLKLLNFIDWSWWQVLLPEIIAFVGYAAFVAWFWLDNRATRKKWSKWP